MKIFNTFKKKQNHSIQVSIPLTDGDLPLNDQELQDAKRTIVELNLLMKTNKYTNRIELSPNSITKDSYVRHTPYTPTGKNSKYPKMIMICSTMYKGYSCTLYYFPDGSIGKGTLYAYTPKLNYTIEIKKEKELLCIKKVIATDHKGNSETVFHIRADGTILQK